MVVSPAWGEGFFQPLGEHRPEEAIVEGRLPSTHQTFRTLEECARTQFSTAYVFVACELAFYWKGLLLQRRHARAGRLAQTISRRVDDFRRREREEKRQPMNLILVVPDISRLPVQYKNRASANYQLSTAHRTCLRLRQCLVEYNMQHTSVVLLQEAYPIPFRWNFDYSEKQSQEVLGARKSCYVGMAPVPRSVIVYIFLSAFLQWNGWVHLVPMPHINTLLHRDYAVSITDVWVGRQKGSHKPFNPMLTSKAAPKTPNRRGKSSTRKARERRRRRERTQKSEVLHSNSSCQATLVPYDCSPTNLQSLATQPSSEHEQASDPELPARIDSRATTPMSEEEDVLIGPISDSPYNLTAEEEVFHLYGTKNV